MTLQFAIELALLTLGYWLFDLAVRQDGLVRLLGLLGLKRAPLPSLFLVGVLGAISWRWSWEVVPQGDALRLIGAGIASGLAWKATTKDIEIVSGEGHLFERLVLLVSVVGAWFSPAMLVASTLMLTTPFGMWEHHATLPMRVLQASAAFLLLAFGTFWAPLEVRGAILGPLAEYGVDSLLFTGSGVLFFFILTIQISHYIITALAKGWLGPKWYSWVKDNQVAHLMANAYSWGWARWMPWSRWYSFIRLVKRFTIPMQLYAFGIELLAPLALLDRSAAIFFCFGWSAFHFGVFVTAGLLFWDWVMANVLVAAALLLVPEEVLAPIFGWQPMLLAMVFMLVFPLRHKLWKPMPLGWWDTPFTQRMRWYAHGESGEVYEVYNDFMDPHERLYGKVHACFLAPAPVCTYHLGEVYKHDLRDALREAGPTLAGLESVRERFGIQPRSEELADRHRKYLKAFFHALNEGKRKHVLPPALRWLKAPGGQIFYWGEGKRFARQERIEKVSIRYFEEYFDGEKLVRLREEHVEDIVVEPVEEIVYEPTPKEMDLFLLEFAKGRLVDLPDFGEGFVKTDDGKART